MVAPYKNKVATMPLSDTNFDSWQLGDVQTSSKGVKSACLTTNGQPVYVQLTPQAEPLTTPFGAGSFNNEETNRKTLDLRVNPELYEFLRRLDEWARMYLADNAQRLFKGKTPDYRECLQKRGEYPESVRTKINVSGQRACRFWNEHYEKIEMPEDLRQCGLVPRVQVKSLYVMGKEVGLVLEVTDLLCILPTETCPFAVSFE